MQSGFYAGTGGMVSQFHKLETITNNLANLNTTGFKRDEKIFGDYMRMAKDSHDELPLQNHTRESSKFYNRTMTRVPQVVDEYSDFSMGSMKQTHNPLDLALAKDDVFFVVEAPDGFHLTRDGSFTTNENGQLVTRQGFAVLDTDLRPIEIDMNENIAFDKAGAFMNGNNDGELLVVQPENLRTLQKMGNGLYKITDQNELVSAEDLNVVRQGYLEGSNVNAVLEMSSLIEANRMVGMYQKVMDTQMNQLNRDAIEKLATNRA
ncbi:Flagellar hook-basal body protein FlgG [Thiovulum sp. ES]|nr:Flagellar hook-basal body protein FlgG [Thiovulum sp. ES]